MKPQKILVCGRPGTGKTTLARQLQNLIPGSIWYDGDSVRTLTGNLAFDPAGRRLQCSNMKLLCEAAVQQGHVAIASFVCPTLSLREFFDADFTIWTTSLNASVYADTDKIFQEVCERDYRATFGTYDHAKKIMGVLERTNLSPVEFDWKAPTAIMIGRFQPWHKGHRALFELALEKYGQVCILLRTMPVDAKNPMEWEAAQAQIHSDLSTYHGRYIVLSAPNTAAVVYGRNVGYNVHEMRFSPEIESISATALRDGATGTIGLQCSGAKGGAPCK